MAILDRAAICSAPDAQAPALHTDVGLHAEGPQRGPLSLVRLPNCERLTQTQRPVHLGALALTQLPMPAGAGV